MSVKDAGQGCASKAFYGPVRAGIKRQECTAAPLTRESTAKRIKKGEVSYSHLSLNCFLSGFTQSITFAAFFISLFLELYLWQLVYEV